MGGRGEWKTNCSYTWGPWALQVFQTEKSNFQQQMVTGSLMSTFSSRKNSNLWLCLGMVCQAGSSTSPCSRAGPGAGAKGKDRVLSLLQPRDEARKEPEMLTEASCNSLTAVFKRRSCHGNWYPGFCVLVQEVLALREPGSHTLVP